MAEDYALFLKHRRRMERSIGKHIVDLIERGRCDYVAPQRVPGEISLTYSTGVVIGTDRPIISLIALSGVSKRRERAAAAAYRSYALTNNIKV